MRAGMKDSALAHKARRLADHLWKGPCEVAAKGAQRCFDLERERGLAWVDYSPGRMCDACALAWCSGTVATILERRAV